ncbi:MAG TPA: multidrug efflux RND transporter permease subunit [Candidatus Binataceae bacterium]|nr:multidrug efflux RND transporter permease subunit [Candidatus Binataceae bacterium]
MGISDPFIRKPVATTLLVIALMLVGMLAFRHLPVSPIPQVDFPTIQVQAQLPGASPQTMASSVATPLERQFGRIAGLTELTSSSTLGFTTIVLQFDLSRDIDAAAREVEAAINAARSQLPTTLPQNPTYRKVNPSDSPIMMLGLTSDTITRGQIYDLASSIMAQKLSQIQGVGQVIVGGGALPAVRVELNPTQLTNYGIGLDQVRAALAAANANIPKGELANNQESIELGANDQLMRASLYKPLIIAYHNGAAVRVSDVAQVVDSVQDVRNAGIVDGKPGILIIIFRQPQANIIETVDRIRAALPQLDAVIPPAIKTTIVLDRTTTIRASVRDTERTLIIAVMLVVLVVFLFLRSLRATVIPGIVVPVSLTATFAVMYLLGYSLDNLSLMALTIATGFVVDDAIVVVENINRYLEDGYRPMQAALLGARNIGFTVFSISISLCAVFIPILLMGGIVGRLFREFAVTLSVAILLSMVISLTATPMMCAHLLRAPGQQRHGRLYQLSERGFKAVLRGYDRSLSWVLGHPRQILVVAIATLAFNIYLFYIIPKGFFPLQDTGRIIGVLQADQDTSFQALSKTMTKVINVIKTDPAVEHVNGWAGASAGSTNVARMFITLKPIERRRDHATLEQIMGRIRRKLTHFAGGAFYMRPAQDLTVGGRLSNALYQYTIQGDDLDELNAFAPKLLARLRRLPQLMDVNSDQQSRGLDATLVVDKRTAGRLGITQQQIDDALYDAFGQRPVSTMYTALNQYYVIMEVAPRFWQRPDSLNQIYVRSATAGEVPLSAFTHYVPTSTLLAVNHQGQFPAVTISFNLRPGVSLGQAVDAINKAAQGLNLPGDVIASFQGTAQAFQSSLSNEPMLILAALISVYIALGILYESYVHPITILSTLPSAGVGALLALLLFHNDLNVVALIGIILLIGIVKKNAIIMIDFALEAERSEGKDAKAAIYQACLLRFRPIMMTTLAALFGGLPLALGHGTGSELRRPLGISIVGGLLFSQALTLYTTPVIYLYLDKARLWGLSQRKRVFRHHAPREVLETHA